MYQTISKDASGNGKTISYTYDHEGVRTSKTVNGTTHNYIYASGKLLRESYGSTVLDFFYDANGRPYAMSHNGTVYYYILNLQGDVVAMVTSAGSIAAEYQYDPYGRLISSSGTMSAINPLRYRGYYYDTDSGLYYLQSRYYDPAIGRFINADEFTSTGQGLLGNNMFAYCLNNPIKSVDPTGTLTFGAFVGAVVGGALGGALISTVSYAVTCGLNGQSITRDGLASAAVSGAISGAIGGASGTISVGATVVSTVQKIIPGVTKKILTAGAKLVASVAAGALMSREQMQPEIVFTSSTTSTFMGSLIDATTNSFFSSSFCNYAATLFVGTAVEVITVAVK